jgi:hypothetical protein
LFSRYLIGYRLALTSGQSGVLAPVPCDVPFFAYRTWIQVANPTHWVRVNELARVCMAI